MGREKLRHELRDIAAFGGKLDATRSLVPLRPGQHDIAALGELADIVGQVGPLIMAEGLQFAQ